MRYVVKTFRDAGLKAKWGKTRHGAPCIFASWPDGMRHQRDTSWLVDAGMWKLMGEHGMVEGFDQATCMGDVFSIPA